jgi:hypothetical protein
VNSAGSYGFLLNTTYWNVINGCMAFNNTIGFCDMASSENTYQCILATGNGTGVQLASSTVSTKLDGRSYANTTSNLDTSGGTNFGASNLGQF